MIGTSSGLTPFTTQDVADALGCSPKRSTRRLQDLTDRLVNAALSDPRVWAATGRPDRVARGLTEFLAAAGALAAAEPQKFRGWIEELVSERREASHDRR